MKLFVHRWWWLALAPAGFGIGHVEDHLGVPPWLVVIEVVCFLVVALIVLRLREMRIRRALFDHKLEQARREWEHRL